MRSVKRILCATDFSRSSEKAVRYAENLAIDLDAELILLHAFEAPVNWTAEGQKHPEDPKIKEQLDDVLVGSPLGDKLSRVLHAGPPAPVICWIGQEHQCDLIVMGTHGRTGLHHLLFGSVAEAVLRDARCPVLCIRDRDPGEPPMERPWNMPVLAPRMM
ncbi:MULTISPECIES: universal stress protein [unclassified Schlesneria]|uniref:universal stress protein n=1 Tax=Schlesneria TaxID=656899 RepID=UPI002F016829